jgi:BirA family biotin operon repressor/biotin-[acetyl-CoA-carboxylase] ligase
MNGEALIRVLADGQSHSGEVLARMAGVSRAAVWKQVRKLDRWGLSVLAERGRGYRLAQPIDLLDGGALEQGLCTDDRFDVDCVEVMVEIPSTNRHVLDHPPRRERAMRICVAEFQNAGRGRRGRRWNVPFGAGLCLSAGWRFAGNPEQLSAITLAVGVVVARALKSACGVDISLKWPNDLVWDGRKLGGVLVELVAEPHGSCHVVVGVGINVDVNPEMLPTLCDWTLGAVDLRSIVGVALPRRTQLAVSVAGELGALFAAYPESGFDAFRAQWQTRDHLYGREVVVLDSSDGLTGTACGIDVDGALLVESASGLRRVVSGDVSVRPA